MCNETRKPDAWVTCGMVEQDQLKPSWYHITTSEDQVLFWQKECGMRVRPIYLGEELPIIYDTKKDK